VTPQLSNKTKRRPVRRPATATEKPEIIRDTFLIDAIGIGGDGLARDGFGNRFFIPGALPGETVTASFDDSDKARGANVRRADLKEIVTTSPDRVTPPCPNFGVCGGCTLQHLALPATLAWKVDLVTQALGRAGFVDAPITDTRQTPPATRRRVDLGVRRTHDSIALGFHQRAGDLIDITHCDVIDPALLALIGQIRPLFNRLRALRSRGDVIVNLLDTGPDILLQTDGELTSEDRVLLADFARANRIARIAWALTGQKEVPEIAAQVRPISQTFGDVSVAPPPGAFLQASPQSEAAIVETVVGMLPAKMVQKDEIIELYAGCGTLTFPLSQKARVHAFEGAPEAFAALRAACGGTRATSEQRDLNRQPVMKRDLTGRKVVVLDPPHMGAGAQIAEIASAKPANVIYVSCNPTALTKDATQLRAAGYELDRVTVVDQFLWSTNVEAICLFTHPNKGRQPRT